jgi:integrase
MRRHERPLPRVNPSGRKVWVARYTDRHGKRRSAGTFDLRRDAQEAIWQAYDREAGGSPKLKTVRAYYERWLDDHPRSERTAKSYEGRLRSVLDVKVDGALFGDWIMEDVRRSQARQLVRVLLVDQGRAASGAQGVLRALSAMWRDAMDDEYVEDRNPFHGLTVRASDPRVKKPPRRVRVWSWEQMHEFAAAAGEHEAMVRVLSDCGLRLGEMLALERRHWSGDALEVRQTAWEGRIQAGTKIDHGQADAGRIAPVPPALQELLRARPVRLASRLLFPGPTNWLWDAANWRRDVWLPAREASGMDPTPHEFRHSYVSLLRAEGVNQEDLAAICGHSVMTATRHYAHALNRSGDAVRQLVGRRG